jgi:hypothetical protein
LVKFLNWMYLYQDISALINIFFSDFDFRKCVNILCMKEFRSYLKSHSHEKLCEDLLVLFRKNKGVKEFFTLKIKPEGEQILFEQILEKIKNDFEKTSTGRVSLHLSDLRAQIKNFEKMVSNPELGIQLRLAIVSEGLNLVKEFIQLKEKEYKSIAKFYSNAISMIIQNNLNNHFHKECLELLLNYQDYGVKIKENMKYEYEYAFSEVINVQVQEVQASQKKFSSKNRSFPDLDFDTLKKKSIWYKDTQKIINNFVQVDYINERASFRYADRLGKILDRIIRQIPKDSESTLHAFKFLITKLPEAFDAVDDSCGVLGMKIDDVIEELIKFILPYSSDVKLKVFQWLFNDAHFGDEYGYFYKMNDILLRTVSGTENDKILEKIYDDYLQTPKIQNLLKNRLNQFKTPSDSYPLRHLHTFLFPLKIRLGKLDEVLKFAEKSIPRTEEYFLLVDLLLQKGEKEKALKLAKIHLPKAKGTYKYALEEQIWKINAYIP